jgi:hypothetical protein
MDDLHKKAAAEVMDASAELHKLLQTASVSAALTREQRDRATLLCSCLNRRAHEVVRELDRRAALALQVHEVEAELLSCEERWRSAMAHTVYWIRVAEEQTRKLKAMKKKRRKARTK